MKKKHQHFLFLSILTGIIISLSSCYGGPYISDPYYVSEIRQKDNLYYVPSAPNAPLLSQKNDASFNVMATSNSKFSGVELQASYMAGKHIGIMASYSHAGSTGNTGYFKYNRFELGSGFVTQLSKDWQFETYAGLGSGTILNTHYTGSSKLGLTHYFIQPSFVISSKDKKVQFGFISKFAGTDFNVMDTSFRNDREAFSAGQLKSLYDKPFHIVWEPGFVFRAGWKNLQFRTGYSFSADLTNPNLYKADGNFSIGICLRMNTGDIK